MQTLRFGHLETSLSSNLVFVHRKIGFHIDFAYSWAYFIGSVFFGVFHNLEFYSENLLNFCQKMKLYVLLNRVVYVPWSFGDTGVEIKFSVSSIPPHCPCPTIGTDIFSRFPSSPKGVNSM